MKGNLNKLISLGLSVVVLWGVYAILMREPPKEKKASEDNEITLAKHENHEISSVNVEFPLGQAFTVNVKPDGETISYELTGGMDGVEYDSSKLEGLVSSVADLSVKEVEPNRDKIKDYGFDAVSEKVSINYKDGKKDTITLGMDNANLGTYMLFNEDPKIYLLDSGKSAQIKSKLESYRSLDIINGISDVTSEINRLYIDKFGEKGKERSFEVVRRPADEMSEEKAIYYSAFVMKQPRQADAVDDDLVQKIFMPLSGSFNASAIAEDFPKDLSIYGLDKPVKIEIKTDNVEKTLLVGAEKGESRFVMIQGGNTVFEVAKSTFSFLNNDYRDYCTAVLWTHNIKDVSKMTVVYDNQTYETVLKHGDNDSLTAETNGKAIDEEKARNLFAKIISVRMEDQLDKPAKESGITAQLKLTYTNGKSYNIRFIKGASRQYIASLNDGEFIYTVNTTCVDEIVKLLK